MKKHIFILFLFLFTSCSSPWSKDESFELEGLEKTTVENITIKRTVVAYGSIQPLIEVEVKSEASGIVSEVLVEKGDKVQKDQELIKLDEKLLKSKLNQALATKTSSEASLKSSELELESSRRNLERTRELVQKGFGTQEELFQAEERFERSELTLRIQEANLQEVLERVNEAQEELRNATIYSALDGTVLNLLVEEGSAVSSATGGMGGGTSLLVVGDMQTMKFLGLVDETEVSTVEEGMDCSIQVQSQSDSLFKGTLYRVYPMGIDYGGIINYQIEVRIDNPEYKLLPKMTGEARFTVSEFQAIGLPDTALIFEDSKTFVWKMDEKGIPKRTLVTIGKIGDENVEILSGLSTGDEVVNRPPADLEMKLIGSKRSRGRGGPSRD